MNPEIYIDTPGSFALSGRYLRMRGWCFLAGFTFDRVQLVLPDRTFFGRYGTFRPDVLAAYPGAPDDFTGFELRARVPAGKYPAEIQFRDSDGEWHTGIRIEISAPRKWCPLWSSRSQPRDLVAFQLSVQSAHAPRPLLPERFPTRRTSITRSPKFSIVTPSYNQRNYLAETMDSVLGQKNADIFYVVQDGGSSDGSVDLIRERAHQLSGWASAPDAGQADAIAKGFARTQGRPDDLMAWLNSDDVYLPGVLSYVTDYFARHPEVDVLYGQRVLIDENSQEIGRWFLPPHNEAMLKLNDFVPQETLFWRRRIWDRVGGLNTTFKFAMDWDLLLRFQSAGAQIVRVPYFLACFRVHATQKTSAQMESVGQREIDLLRAEAQGRLLSPADVEDNPLLLSYLRRSAWQEFLWKLGLRGR